MKAIKRIIYLSTWELFKLIKETRNDCSKLFLGRLVFLSGSFLKSMNSIYSSSITIPKQKIHQRLQHPCHLNYASFICCWNISLLFLHLPTEFLNVLYLLPLMSQLTFASPVGPILLLSLPQPSPLCYLPHYNMRTLNKHLFSSPLLQHHFITLPARNQSSFLLKKL